MTVTHPDHRLPRSTGWAEQQASLDSTSVVAEVVHASETEQGAERFSEGGQAPGPGCSVNAPVASIQASVAPCCSVFPSLPAPCTWLDPFRRSQGRQIHPDIVSPVQVLSRAASTPTTTYKAKQTPKRTGTNNPGVTLK